MTGLFCRGVFVLLTLTSLLLLRRWTPGTRWRWHFILSVSTGSSASSTRASGAEKTSSPSASWTSSDSRTLRCVCTGGDALRIVRLINPIRIKSEEEKKKSGSLDQIKSLTRSIKPSDVTFYSPVPRSLIVFLIVNEEFSKRTSGIPCFSLH